MNILVILLVILLIAGAGSWPSFGWHHYGYYPSGIVGLLVLLLILRLLGVF